MEGAALHAQERMRPRGPGHTADIDAGPFPLKCPPTPRRQKPASVVARLSGRLRRYPFRGFIRARTRPRGAARGCRAKFYHPRPQRPSSLSSPRNDASILPLRRAPTVRCAVLGRLRRPAVGARVRRCPRFCHWRPRRAAEPRRRSPVWISA